MSGDATGHHRHRRPRAHGGVLTTLPWLRAPLLLTRRPVVFVAIVAAAAILTMAAASGPLFLSTVGTASLNSQAEQSCPEQSRPGMTTTAYGARLAEKQRAGTAAMRRSGLPAPRSTVVGEATVQSTLIHLFASAGALDHVTRLTPSAGAGVWVPDDFARKLAIRPGGTVTTTDGKRMRVAGIYRALAPDPFSLADLPRYWCSWNDIIVSTVATDSAVASTPPDRRQGPLFITDQKTVAAVVPGAIRLSWHSPMSTRTNPLGAFDAAYRRVERAADTAGPSVVPDKALPRLTRAAHSARDGIAGTVVPIEVAGVIIAGLLVGGAGMFWANARRREIRLLVARGVGPGALAGKAVLETLPPAAVGAGIGFGGTLLLVRGVGPAQVFEDGAPLQALGVVAGVVALGLLVIGIIGALAGRERTVGRRRSWLAVVPWELALIAAALVIAVPRLDANAVTVENNVVQVSPLVILYPLLGATGALLLLGRLLGGLLPSVGRATRRGPVTAMLALRRMSRSRAIAVGVIIGTALPCCLLMYGNTVRDTVSHEVADKYRTNLGAPHVLQIYGVRGALFDLKGDGTQVVIYDQNVTIGDEPATVLGVDTKTFDRFAFTSGAQRSAVSKLGPARDGGKVPAIVANSGGVRSDDLRVSRTSLALDRVASPALFPGLRDGSSPLVVVDQRTLGRIDNGTERSNQVWTTDADYGKARRLVDERGYSVLFELTSKVIVGNTGLLPVTWVFGYLQALAVLIGIVAVAGLVFGLASRTRHRRVSYVLSRRMGMSRLTHVNSLLLELGTVLGLGWVAGSGLGLGSVGVVARRLDIYPDLPPPARFELPVPALLLTGALVVAVVALATLATQMLAERTRPAEILRLE